MVIVWQPGAHWPKTKLDEAHARKHEKDSMSEKILFVDDDSNLLASCERNFRRQFPLDTAEGGQTGLEKLETSGPYAVVVADRQMPLMDGIQFLSLVKERAPDTVRIMLTGNADMESTIRVVNEGNIFRFLTKPCPLEILTKALSDGCAQYRLVTAEKELLNNTLSGSIKLLTDMLSTMDAGSFERATKVRQLLDQVRQKMPVEQAWEVQLAAMLSSIGSVTLPPETVLKARAGKPLSKAEEQLFGRLPDISARLLANIPRLEGVSNIVRYQQKHFDGSGYPDDSVRGEEIPLGARLLMILDGMVELGEEGALPLQNLNKLQLRTGWYDAQLMTQIRHCFGARDSNATEARPVVSVKVEDLVTGMILRSDVYTKDGTLVLKSGHELDDVRLEKIQNFDSVSGIKTPIFVENPNDLNSASQSGSDSSAALPIPAN